jgi:predicted P-loop ATPase
MSIPTKDDLLAALIAYSPNDSGPALAKVFEICGCASVEELRGKPEAWADVIAGLKAATPELPSAGEQACDRVLAAIQALDLTDTDSNGIQEAKQGVYNQICGAWDSIGKPQRKLLIKALRRKLPGEKPALGELVDELELRRQGLRAVAPRARLQGLMLNDKSQPLSNTHNAIAAVAGSMHGTVHFDEFKQRVTVHWPEETERDWTDVDTTRLQAQLQKAGMASMSATSVRDAVELVAHQHPTNGIAEWLLGLQWDGTRRLSTWMTHALGTPSDRYHIRAGRNMFIGLVARAMRPGCQVDEAVVLEGPQGSFKSSALGVIGGEYFKELTANPNSKDFEQQLLGVWLGEFAELDALRRTEVTRIKQFMTNRTDHFRLPYGREYVDLARRIVFCGSTNNTEWLNDPTGGRRFIPVRVGKVDLGWLRANREQLFAEAVRLFQAGRKWHRYPKEETLAQQEQRSVEDPWEDLIARYLCGRQEVTVADIINHALDLPARDQNKAASTRVGMTLGRLGCVSKPLRRVSGKPTRAWTVPGAFASQKLKVMSIGVEQEFNSPEATPPSAAQARPAKTSKTDQPSEAPAPVAAAAPMWEDGPAAEPAPQLNGNGAAHEDPAVERERRVKLFRGIKIGQTNVGQLTAECLAAAFPSLEAIGSATIEELIAAKSKGKPLLAADAARLQQCARDAKQKGA